MEIILNLRKSFNIGSFFKAEILKSGIFKFSEILFTLLFLLKAMLKKKIVVTQ